MSSINLINTLAQPLRFSAKFVNHNEQASGLSTSRFIQDTSTCLLPKAVFARSKADLAENTFLELSESGLVYFAPILVGNAAKNIYTRNLSSGTKKLVTESASKLIEQNNAIAKRVLPVKAAIALSALLIPLTEFTLNYIKNIMTLNVFKKGDFNNIANLENKQEDKQTQNRVRQNAHKNIKTAAGIFGLSTLVSVMLAARGASKSKAVKNISEAILAPGTKFFKDNEKAKKFFNKYFSIDYASENGKLVLSKGQLTSCVVIGGAGYFGAAKDRGKQNFLETLFRYPVVGFYVITGSELFEKGFKKLLQRAGKFRETIGKNLEVPSFKELENIAQRLANAKSTTVEKEFSRLAKQKVLISGVPYIFSIGVMGFFVSDISNLFTKYRFTKEQSKKY